MAVYICAKAPKRLRLGLSAASASESDEWLGAGCGRLLAAYKATTLFWSR